MKGKVVSFINSPASQKYHPPKGCQTLEGHRLISGNFVPSASIRVFEHGMHLIGNNSIDPGRPSNSKHTIPLLNVAHEFAVIMSIDSIQKTSDSARNTNGKMKRGESEWCHRDARDTFNLGNLMVHQIKVYTHLKTKSGTSKYKRYRLKGFRLIFWLSRMLRKIRKLKRPTKKATAAQVYQ